MQRRIEPRFFRWPERDHLFYLPPRRPDPGLALISPRPFLTARWRHLAMLNYEIDAAALAQDMPAGTEADTWRGRAFVSMVGFLFLETRVLGVPLFSSGPRK